MNVIRPDGKPESEAVVYASETAAIRGNREAVFGGQSSTTTTNALGVAVLKDWFSFASILPPARGESPIPRKPANGPQPIPMRFNPNGTALPKIPRRVDAFSASGIFQGSASIPVPSVDHVGPLEMDLKLQRTASVEGRVLDQNEQPVAGITVSAQSVQKRFTQGAQVWKTKTRNDGRFRLTGLAPGSPLTFTIGERYEAKRLQSMELITSIDWANNLTPGGTLKHPDLRCQDFRSLGEPLPPINLRGLNSKESIEKVLVYAVEQMQRVEDLKPVRGTSDTESSVDPVPVFGERLIPKIMTGLEDAFAKDPGSDEALDCIRKLLSAINQTDEFRISEGTRKLKTWAVEMLLKDFKGRADGEKLILEIVQSIHMPTDKIALLETTFPKVKQPETKMEAGWLLMDIKISTLRGSFRWNFNARTFERDFEKLESLIAKVKQLKGSPSKSLLTVTSQRIETFSKETNAKWTSANKQLRESEAFQTQRRCARKLIEAVERLLQQHPGGNTGN